MSKGKVPSARAELVPRGDRGVLFLFLAVALLVCVANNFAPSTSSLRTLPQGGDE